jgi:hypothetical protein
VVEIRDILKPALERHVKNFLRWHPVVICQPQGCFPQASTKDVLMWSEPRHTSKRSKEMIGIQARVSRQIIQG